MDDPIPRWIKKHWGLEYLGCYKQRYRFRCTLCSKTWDLKDPVNHQFRCSTVVHRLYEYRERIKQLQQNHIIVKPWPRPETVYLRCVAPTHNKQHASIFSVSLGKFTGPTAIRCASCTYQV